MVWMGIRIFSTPIRTGVLMGGSRQGLTQRCSCTQSLTAGCCGALRGRTGGSLRPCLHEQQGWGAAADSAAPQIPQCQKGWAALGEAQPVLGVSPRRGVLGAVIALISITWTMRRSFVTHSSVGMFWVGAALRAGAAHTQPGLFVWLCALEGTKAGKENVLGDLVQVPAVPLITGELLSLPTL